ncbi:hypothetical protein GGTG_06868 [Gaeumannomyces tritici R3-111a-1]|uniref:Uncharacterized protein n=1 Tax=Gaeumannomyces tritici (strain R3-111a-1) TaxID=644352 RepID=J3P021_GAET3|nr:hypothetical protein GGTG_06868 [Gaeumannomyces tritici R3-111a-1]EJT76954.1 hypothetical protein GGTG_06868 [Gaeumannomyces tritici R3-111a-1]
MGKHAPDKMGKWGHARLRFGSRTGPGLLHQDLTRPRVVGRCERGRQRTEACEVGAIRHVPAGAGRKVRCRVQWRLAAAPVAYSSALWRHADPYADCWMLVQWKPSG